MKKFFFALILFSLFFSSYTSPPIEEVLSFNLGASHLLANKVPSGIHPSKDNPVAYSNFDLIMVSPSVDNRISNRTNHLFLTYGFSVYSGTGSGGCPLDFYGQSIVYTINFIFKNQSRIISGTYDSPSSIPTHFQVPFSPQDLSGANANDSLLINLSWSHTASYFRYTEFNGSCIYDGLAEYGSSGVDSISYIVEGGDVLFFLSKPVLREQWFRNNHFDFISFTNRRLYSSQILKNNDQLSSNQIYAFEVVENGYGLRQINSNYSANSSYSLAESVFIPSSIQSDNSSYSFAYSFNSTYEGLGKNNLSAILYDFFGNEYIFEEELTSRKLTFNSNISEEGEIAISKDFYRPSASYSKEDVNFFIVPLSLIGLLFILVFINFRD